MKKIVHLVILSVKIGGLGYIYTLNNHRYGTTIQTAYLRSFEKSS